MKDIKEIQLDILGDGSYDYFGLWAVVKELRVAYPDTSDSAIRVLNMDLIRPLVHKGLVDVGPTDIDIETWEEHPWPGPPEAIMARIEALWDEVGEPKMWDICWMLTTEAGKAALKEEKI